MAFVTINFFSWLLNGFNDTGTFQLLNGFCYYQMVSKIFKWLQWYFSTIEWLFFTIKWFQRLSNGFNDPQYFLTAKWFHELLQIAFMILFDCQIAFVTIKCFHDFKWLQSDSESLDCQMAFLTIKWFSLTLMVFNFQMASLTISNWFSSLLNGFHENWILFDHQMTPVTIKRFSLP